MVRSLLLTLTMLFGCAGVALAQNSTVLTGKVTDAQGEALIGASVKIMRGTDVVRGAITDYNGEFRLQIDPGAYDVEFAYTGYATSRVTGVQVLTNQINFLNTTLSEGTVLTEAVVTAFRVPLIEQDKTSGGQTLTSETIKNLPTRSLNAIVATTAGTTSIDGGAVNIKGSRANATNYYLDGIRVQGAPPPVQDIEQIQIITGGLGAEYGDVTGGVVSVVTKGPASEYNGYVEIENSHGLDAFGWLLGTANVSGPLVKRKRADGSRETLIGFRLSGQWLSQKDDDPPAFAVHRAKQSVIDRIERNPLQLVNGSPVAAGEYITSDSVDTYNYRPFEDRRDIDVTGKIDFRLSSNIDISLTGTYRNSENQFTPTGNGGWSDNNWLLLNAHNNPTQFSDRYRGIFRFRHRLGSGEGDGSGSNRISISNASYQLQFGFERASDNTSDPRHGDRLFDYGYVGTFAYDYVPTIGLNVATEELIHEGYLEAFQGYQAHPTINPGMAAYNEFANPEIPTSYYAQNGRLSGVYDNLWGGMHSNISRVYNSHNKGEDDIITILASSGFDLKLGRTGTHNIQFGLMNEQRTQRNYNVAPFGLWILMDQSANIHFNGLDTNNVIGQIPIPELGISIDQYAPATVELGDAKFYRAIRDQLDLEIWEYVNVHELNPGDLSLDLFSPRELTDQQLINYYGYNHLGEKLDPGVTFNDFFTSKDEDGIRDFPVAPLRPLYQAAFIKDKFTFNKMIVSLGMRVERFDLNTKVMRDPYSLYEVKDAASFHATVPGAGAKPANIGDDYKVYVNGINDPSVKAYRNGNTWYYDDGTQANDGNLIFGGGVVVPFLQDTVTGDDITLEGFRTETAFEDYTPQINWLPRLAFSFPISEDANFFMHYDILVQRPPSNWEVTPLDYFYFYIPGRTPGNNANLRPERVTDYEVGFQQRLNQNSALKFSAYYRELRDMIQSRTILYVPTIGRYDTYGNEDFGTVKGFTVQYDLRRIQNAELRLAYTLQFADGTGSDANSQRGLTTRGNIRTLFPLNYDERHNIAAIFDYRFASGRQYNGPRIGNSDILSNFGVNIQASAASGRPYTANLRPSRFGSSGAVGAINGNRLPWRFNLDMRVDKSINLAPAGKKDLVVNVYLRVANLLDRRNVVGVYRYTGSPTDDGYLATAEGQGVVENVAAQEGRSVQAYLNSYSWAMLNPNNFTQPRRIYIGASFAF